jgi:hypothetical protein
VRAHAVYEYHKAQSVRDGENMDRSGECRGKRAPLHYQGVVCIETQTSPCKNARARSGGTQSIAPTCVKPVYGHGDKLGVTQKGPRLCEQSIGDFIDITRTHGDE